MRVRIKLCGTRYVFVTTFKLNMPRDVPIKCIFRPWSWFELFDMSYWMCHSRIPIFYITQQHHIYIKGTEVSKTNSVQLVRYCMPDNCTAASKCFSNGFWLMVTAVSWSIYNPDHDITGPNADLSDICICLVLFVVLFHLLLIMLIEKIKVLQPII